MHDRLDKIPRCAEGHCQKLQVLISTLPWRQFDSLNVRSTHLYDSPSHHPMLEKRRKDRHKDDPVKALWVSPILCSVQLERESLSSLGRSLSTSPPPGRKIETVLLKRTSLAIPSFAQIAYEQASEMEKMPSTRLASDC